MSFAGIVDELERIDLAYKSDRDRESALTSYRRLAATILRSWIPDRWKRG